MQTSGLDHVVLTVSDLKRSYKFYAELLGFAVKTMPTDYPNKIFAGGCYFMVGDVEIFLVSHAQTPSHDQFSEMRIGLDHLSFKAPDEAALHTLADKLLAAGIQTKGVQVFAPNGKNYVVFRDPDNIQLEYWLDKP